MKDMAIKTKINKDELKERMNWPLDRKIQESHHRMEQWFNYWKMRGRSISLSFSGGLDSTVMLHLLKTNPFLKDEDIQIVFADTGVEYPEIREFAKSIEGIQVVKPKMPFKKVIENYGYPVVSKKVSRSIEQIRRNPECATSKLYLTGINSKGKESPSWKLAKRWLGLIEAPFLISEKCCDVIKKNPMAKIKNPMIGVRATESEGRLAIYQQKGCNLFDSNKPRSWPIAFWTGEDIQEYIKMTGLKYCPIYDMGYARTGCYPCMFGLHMEDRKKPNRFQLMQKTHPKLWNYSIDYLGIGKVIEYLNELLPKKKKLSYYWDDDHEQKQKRRKGFNLKP